MKEASFTYCVVRYVHDPSAGEMLNVGVVLLAPDERFVGARFEHRYERLSRAFAGFDGDSYKRAVDALSRSVLGIGQELTGLPFNDPPVDADAVVSRILPDAGLCFASGVLLGGITADPAQELERIFERTVTMQGRRVHIERRTDEEVYSAYAKRLPKSISRALRPQTFSNDDIDVKFDHAFKNESWHVVQPISLDYLQPEGIQRKVTSMLGNAVALEGHPDLRHIYLLVGRPREEEYQRAYTRALHLLDKIPISHQLFEEDEADEFAEFLTEYMYEHGLVDSDHVAQAGESEPA